MSVRTYGGTYRGECRTERCEQIDAMGWLEKNHPERWPLIFHCPGETKARPQHMQMRRKEGVRPGVPDIIDLGGPVNGLFEMKRLDARKSKLSKEQREFLELAAYKGHFCAVCCGFEAFKQAYADFLQFVGESV